MFEINVLLFKIMSVAALAIKKAFSVRQENELFL